jgi:cytochrome d ubiquinol oxidase subunit I
MRLDPLLLSRLQFVWVVSLHILLPTFTVGLASFIAVLEGLHLATRRAIYLRISQFWIKIFGVSFGVGVVSGLVMPFQFGTNWSRFSYAAADIFGPLMGYEGLTAFFLEAGFLGVLLFGRHLVPPAVHFVSALIVAFGTLFSSFWILAVNSWMQTPAGYEIIDGRFFPADWMAAIFTPSFPYRLAHTVLAFYISTMFVVVGVAAHYLRGNRFQEEARTMLSLTFAMLTALVPLQLVAGDLHGFNTVQYQPGKIAAIEGDWETRRGAPAVLFAIPDEQAETNRFEVAIPVLGSIYLTHDPNGLVRGLKEWPREDRPPVAIVFFAFRIMVGMGLIMLALMLGSWWLRWRGRLYDTPWFLRLCQFAVPTGFVAVLAGWTTTEVGRQPWVVYGVMRTSQAVTPSLTGEEVLLSLLLYVAAYVVVFGAGLRLTLLLIKAGPTAAPAAPGRPRSPKRLMSGPDMAKREGTP